MGKPVVLIVGAGLAGLAAARELERRGGVARVFEARDRVGGRVLTLRDGFGGMHGEAGADLIEDEQDEVRKLARKIGLREARILRGGFAHCRMGDKGRRRLRSASSMWRRTEKTLQPLLRDYKLNGEEWDGPSATMIARRSVADWLDEVGASTDVRATAALMRNFFVAEPNELSLLVYIEQFASGGNPAEHGMYRLRGGNDRLPHRMARALRRRVRLGHVVRRIAQTKKGVRFVVENARGTRTEISGDYAIVTAPAPLAAEIEFAPALPTAQRDALTRLRYGRATKTLLQFDRHPWRRRGRPRACATDLDIGAVWDGSEDQRGARGILTLLAGGNASEETKAALAAGGAQRLAERLRFFGVKGARVIASRSVSWEDDPWARGAYAFFDPSFPPSARRLLALPWGRIFFAGEHTSTTWQGYMNGAVESGLRAVTEIFANMSRIGNL